MPDTADVPAIRRAHDILRTLAAQPGPVKASELMRACGLPRSTLYLLLDSLEQRRWIERREGGYIVGIELMALGAAYLRHDSLQTAFHRVAAEFVARCNEVVQLAALDGFEVVYLAREDARRPVRLVSDLGLRLPAHACALGRPCWPGWIRPSWTRACPPSWPESPSARWPRPRRCAANCKRCAATAWPRTARRSRPAWSALPPMGVTPLGKRLAVSTSIPSDRLDNAHRQAAIAGIRQVARELAKLTAALP